MDEFGEQQKYRRHISPTYQVIIIVGLIILFLQLYGLASSLYMTNQLDAHIQEFKKINAEKTELVKNKPLDFLREQLKNAQIVALKKTENKVYLDEEQHLVSDSEYLAHKELLKADADTIFKSPNITELTQLPTTERIRIERVAKGSIPSQWKYFLFHVE